MRWLRHGSGQMKAGNRYVRFKYRIALVLSLAVFEEIMLCNSRDKDSLYLAAAVSAIGRH